MLEANLVPTPLIAAADRKQVSILARTQAENWYTTILLLLRWLSAYVWLKLRRGSQRESAHRVRDLFESLGGLWIKVGQLISLRTDLISPELSDELSKLQHQAVGFPFEQVRRIVEAELGGSIEEIFDNFEEAPLAAASVSQVHRARLRKEGVEVAVKVQRPDIARKFARDMTMLRGLVFLLKRLTAFPASSWDEMLWEMSEIMKEEVDYRYEAANMRRMSKTLSKHAVYVPEVFPQSQRHVLVMEFVRGVLMSDFIQVGTNTPDVLAAWMEENNVSREKAGERLFLSFFRQLFEDNLFHGDLHPGNILLLRDSRLAFIDFGTVGTNNAHFLAIYMRGMQAVGEKNYSKGIDYLFLLCDKLPRVNLEMVKQTAVKAYESWGDRTMLSGLSYHEKSIGNMGASAGALLAPYNVVMSWQFMKIGRTWSTLDASLSFLLPDVNFPQLLTKYFKGFTNRLEEKLKKKTLADGYQLVEPFVSEYVMLREQLSMRNAVQQEHAATRFTMALFALAKIGGVGAVVWLWLAPGHDLAGHAHVWSRYLPQSALARVAMASFGVIWIVTGLRAAARHVSRQIPDGAVSTHR